MQNPGDALTQYARAASVGGLWTRLNARNMKNGLPMLLPFGRGAAVQMAADADYVGDCKLSIWNARWYFSDNILFASFLLPAAWVWAMNKVPK
mmetsp:Transcript_90679/g.235155  ORF Transcript_90679/g.235155 Transcript_90679/m.235155 type:complete len:93 (+) Transcript_90679:88-366(+)